MFPRPTAAIISGLAFSEWDMKIIFNVDAPICTNCVKIVGMQILSIYKCLFDIQKYFNIYIYEN